MDAIEPHFFGRSERQLFGIYHRPTAGLHSHGVVLCPPAPQEYMRTHMALRKLALILSRAGFHVLRFDYYGTGDSAGGSSAGSLSEWQANIESAVEDLKDCSGATKVSLVGLRLGAALAARTAVSVANLVLWEPVVSGSAYLEELGAIHQRRFSDLLFPIPLGTAGQGRDLLGFPLSSALESEIRSVDLLAQIACRAEHIVLVASQERQEYETLGLRLGPQGSRGAKGFEQHHVNEASVSDGEGMLLSTQGLQVIASVLTRRVG